MSLGDIGTTLAQQHPTNLAESGPRSGHLPIETAARHARTKLPSEQDESTRPYDARIFPGGPGDLAVADTRA